MDHVRRALLGSLSAALALVGLLASGSQALAQGPSDSGFSASAAASASGSGSLASATLRSTGLSLTGPDPTSPDPTSPDPTSSGPGGTGPATTVVPDGAGPTTTVDPLIDEDAGETVPPGTDTVPPRTGAYADQKAFKPAQVLRSSVKAAQAKLAAATTSHEDLIGQAHQALLDHKVLVERQASLAAQTQATADALAQAEATLRRRSVAAFVANDQATEAIVSTFAGASYDNVLELQARQRLLGVALGSDDDAIDAYRQLRSQLDAQLSATGAALAEASAAITTTEAQATEAGLAVVQAQDELAAFQAGSAVYIAGVVFPVAIPYVTPLYDSFGAPRLPGTPLAHWHEGIDIFAPPGTPLLAAERGLVTSVGSNHLGGLSVWLRGESGTDWYYAHLSSFAPDLVAGMVVEPGQVLGYVGNTGDAATTPSHLHLEIHPNGGDPVDPYPLLNVVSAAEAAARR